MNYNKRICYFCKKDNGFISNSPEYGKWTCEPCYYFLIKSSHKWRYIIRYFKKKKYFYILEIIVFSILKIIVFFKWLIKVPLKIYFYLLFGKNKEYYKKKRNS